MVDYKSMYTHLVDYTESTIVALKRNEAIARQTADVLYDTAAALEKAMRDTEEQFMADDTPE